MAFANIEVVRAELHDVAVRLRVPFTLSGGTMTHRRSLVLVLETKSGVRGFGEAAPFEQPFYSAETTQSAIACLRDVLVPRLVGKHFTHPSDVADALAENVCGNRMARAAAETAWWDLQARTQETALATLVDDRLRALGVPEPIRSANSLVCGAALGIPRDNQMSLLLAAVNDAVARGFHRMKIKVRPGWSVEPLVAVLHLLQKRGIAMDVSVDANAAFRMGEDETELRALDEAGAIFLEQPFAEQNLWDTVVWSSSCTTPICLDESLVSDDVARQILEMGGPTIWNLKIQRLGGLEETCRVYARGARSGVRMWMGTMPETGLGIQSALAFAGCAALAFPSDAGPSSWWFAHGADLVEVNMDSSGRIQVPKTPGNYPKLQGSALLHRWD